MKRTAIQATLYDPKIQHFFENWVIESNLKIKFNVATYYIESKKRNKFILLLKMIGFKKIVDERRILRVLTNQPGYLHGKDGALFNRYRTIFTDKKHVRDIDDVVVIEVKDQERILKGVKRKINDMNMEFQIK